jgi:hypothetical protein
LAARRKARERTNARAVEAEGVRPREQVHLPSGQWRRCRRRGDVMRLLDRTLVVMMRMLEETWCSGWKGRRPRHLAERGRTRMRRVVERWIWL